MKNISVIGAGTMGNGIAHVFAQYGFTVSLIDLNLQQLEVSLSTIARNLDRQVSKGMLTDEQKEQTLQRVKTFPAIAEGVVNADLVIEAATENTQLKLDIFRQLDKLAPKQAVLAT